MSSSSSLSSYAAFDDQLASSGNDHAVPLPCTPSAAATATAATIPYPANTNPSTTSPQHEQLQHQQNTQQLNTDPSPSQKSHPCQNQVDVSPALSITSVSGSIATADSLPVLESSEESVRTFASTVSNGSNSNNCHDHNNHTTCSARYGTYASYNSSSHNSYYLLRRRSSSVLGGIDNLPGFHQQCGKYLCPHRIIVPRWMRHPKFPLGFVVAFVVVFVLVGILTTTYTTYIPRLSVAIIGNSMMYYNDFPRFLEALSDHRIEQDSCLHGDATLHSLLITGSGTYKVWRTGVAQIRNASVELYHDYEEEEKEDKDNAEKNNYNKNFDFSHLYDYGSCTIPQLLFGYDRTLEQKMEDWSFEQSYQSHGDDYFDDDDYYTLDNDDEIYGYDFESFMDGTNPCLMDPNYYKYRNYLYWGRDEAAAAYAASSNNYDVDRYSLYPTAPQWDYILLNDNTRSPAQTQSRQDTLNILEQQYLLWFQETGSTPVFMFTYAYDTPYRDMNGILDIPTFTSLTYEGYRQYAELLTQRLPENQKPKIAPVGLAFLTIWEEAYDFWNEKLFHIDRVHASPHGTYLQGCVVYCTLYGKMPPRKTAIQQLESLWNDARRMAPVKHRRLPLPTREEATYLYHVAERVCIQGHVPKSFVYYQHGESTNYIPTDDEYKNDDIY